MFTTFFLFCSSNLQTEDKKEQNVTFKTQKPVCLRKPDSNASKQDQKKFVTVIYHIIHLFREFASNLHQHTQLDPQALPQSEATARIFQTSLSVFLIDYFLHIALSMKGEHYLTKCTTWLLQKDTDLVILHGTFSSARSTSFDHTCCKTHG